MKAMKAGLVAAVLASAGLAYSVPAAAQRSDTTRAGTRGSEISYPWQQRFWSYAGVNVGTANYDLECVPGFGCEDSAGSLKLFAGGKFNNVFGLEVAYINLGKAEIAGGDMEAHGLNFSLVAGMPIGANSSVFGKLGTTYGRSKVSGTVPAFRTGSEDDWGASFGIGAQIGLTDRWALRVDADRYRFKFVDTDRRNIDTFTAGVQYRF